VASLQRPPLPAASSSASFNESLEDPTKSLQLTLGSSKPLLSTGLSLKSSLDLECAARPEEPVSPPVISTTTNKETSSSLSGTESPPSDVGGSIQAALTALQAGQISLNQLSMQLMALGKIPIFFSNCIVSRLFLGLLSHLYFQRYLEQVV
jgi:hypothetical protein